MKVSPKTMALQLHLGELRVILPESDAEELQILNDNPDFISIDATAMPNLRRITFDQSHSECESVPHMVRVDYLRCVEPIDCLATVIESHSGISIHDAYGEKIAQFCDREELAISKHSWWIDYMGRLPPRSKAALSNSLAN